MYADSERTVRTTALATALDDVHAALGRAADPLHEALCQIVKCEAARLGFPWAKGDDKAEARWRGFRVAVPIPTKTGDAHASAWLNWAASALVDKVREDIGPEGELLAAAAQLTWGGQHGPQPEEFAEGADAEAPRGGPFIVLSVWARAV